MSTYRWLLLRMLQTIDRYNNLQYTYVTIAAGIMPWAFIDVLQILGGDYSKYFE